MCVGMGRFVTQLSLLCRKPSSFEHIDAVIFDGGFHAEDLLLRLSKLFNIWLPMVVRYLHFEHIVKKCEVKYDLTVVHNVSVT